MKKSYLFWSVLIVFPILFLSEKYIAFKELNEHGSLEYKGINFEDLKLNDFVLYSKEGKAVTYFKVEGVSNGTAIVRWGKQDHNIHQEIGDDIYKLDKSWASINFKNRVIDNDDLYTDSLSVISSQEFNTLKKFNYLEIYGYRKFQMPNGSDHWISKLFFSEYTNIVILVLMVFALYIISFITRGLRLFLSNRVVTIVYLLIIIRAFSYFLIMRSSFMYPDSGLIQFLDSVLGVSLIFILFKFLLMKINKKAFVEKEFYKFILIAIGGPLINLIIVYLLDFLYEVLGLGKSKSNLANFDIQLSYQYLMNNWVLLASANFAHNLIYHIRHWQKQSNKTDKFVLDKNLVTAELNALQSRVNPHFLYNSLNAMASLAVTEPQKVEQMAISLAKFYKDNTNRTDETYSTIEAEVEMIKAYLEIEKIRFGDRLNADIQIAPSSLKVKIPKFIIQPLVENAIKYGFSTETDKIKLKLEIDQIDHKCCIRLYDGGSDFDEDLQPGYGVKSIKKKLELLYPISGKFNFVNNPHKFVEIIFDPKENK